MIRVIRHFLIIFFVLAMGIRFQHWLILKGNHDLIHGDFGDSRFVHLLLEHAWKFVTNSSFLAKGYWSPPWNFFPTENSLLMSEVMGGASWNYIIFRMTGLDPISSYQGWFVSTSAVNFLAAVMLARCLGCGLLGSLVSGWVFAFSIIRSAFIAHPQMLPHYYFVFALICAVKSYQALELKKRSLFYACLAGAFLGLQFWASFYLVWFSVLTIGFAILISFFTWRRVFLELMWSIRLPLTCLSVSFVAVAGMLAQKYLAMQSLVGKREWSEVVGFLPKFRALLLPPPHSWIHQFLFESNYTISGWYSEMFMFPGYMAFFSVAVGLLMWIVRKERSVFSFTAILWLVLMIATQHDLWKLVYLLVPGAGAIRAIGRISLAGLLPLSICLGLLAERAMRTMYLSISQLSIKPLITGVVILVAIIIDNGYVPTYAFSSKEHLIRVDTVIKRLDSKVCKVFHYTTADMAYKVELDAMWASMMSQIPSANGYSGGFPRGYLESGLNSGTEIDKSALNRWLAFNGMELADQERCIIRF